jgi:hypothetical protein
MPSSILGGVWSQTRHAKRGSRRRHGENRRDAGPRPPLPRMAKEKLASTRSMSKIPHSALPLAKVAKLGPTILFSRERKLNSTPPLSGILGVVNSLS